MVDKIHKVDVDSLRTRYTEKKPRDEERGSAKKDQEEGQDSRDEFEKSKLDYKKVIADESASRHQASLWNQAPSKELHSVEKELEESVTEIGGEESSVIVLLQAIGILKLNRRPHWGYVSLFAFALIGFFTTFIFVLNALF
jgi:hypothetical protein